MVEYIGIWDMTPVRQKIQQYIQMHPKVFYKNKKIQRYAQYTF